MLNKKHSAILFTILLTSCTTVREEGPCEIVYTKRVSPYYVVKKGDTVESVSSKYCMKNEDLISINNLRPPYTLLPGQRLLVHPKGQGVKQKPKDIEVKPLDEPDSSVAPLNNDIPGNIHLNPDGTIVPQSPDIVADTPHTNTLGNVTAVTSISSSMEWPVKGKIIQAFDGTKSKGINILAPKNTPVKAVADGAVKYSGSHVEGYGQMIMIKHTDGKISTYAHLQSVDTLIKENMTVSKGQQIGTVGNTGLAAKQPPQLHLQIRGADKQPIDPMLFLPKS